MPTINANITHLHFEHVLWLKELSFDEDELSFFEKQLAIQIEKGNGLERLARLEQFQNQFIRQKEVLDKLKRDIRVHEQELSALLKNDAEIDFSMEEQHITVRERMDTFRNLFAQLKQTFFAYLAE